MWFTAPNEITVLHSNKCLFLIKRTDRTTILWWEGPKLVLATSTDSCISIHLLTVFYKAFFTLSRMWQLDNCWTDRNCIWLGFGLDDLGFWSQSILFPKSWRSYFSVVAWVKANGTRSWTMNPNLVPRLVKNGWSCTTSPFIWLYIFYLWCLAASLEFVGLS